jgi:hypothetical protein
MAAGATRGPTLADEAGILALFLKLPINRSLSDTDHRALMQQSVGGFDRYLLSDMAP